MHDVRVIMKDGTKLQAPLWQWRPDLGWFTLVGGDKPIRLAEVESAVQTGTRPTRDVRFAFFVGAVAADVDLLDRARKEGWNGS